MATARQLFSPADLEAIREATAAAEGRTSGEIVPVVVDVCDDYDDVAWKAAALGALAAALAAAAIHHLSGWWPGAFWLWLAGPPAAGAAVGYLLIQWCPGLRRALIPAETLELRVQRRARQAFLEEEVFKTVERTGILIFLALFERKVVVLGDEGINRAVRPEAWRHIVDELVAGITSGRTGAALITAIEACGDLLAEHGVEIRPDDEDELPDGLRMEER